VNRRLAQFTTDEAVAEGLTREDWWRCRLSGWIKAWESLALLRACPNRESFRPVIARGGGISEWIWKGRPNAPGSVEAIVARPAGRPLRHRVALRNEKQSFRLEDETIENERPAKGNDKRCSASPRKRICEVIAWKRTSRTSEWFSTASGVSRKRRRLW
jgi:hypothetical protein